MIDRDHDLPMKRQVAVLRLSRSTQYSRPHPVSAEDLGIMRRLDELHMNYPFAGSRMLQIFNTDQGSQFTSGEFVGLLVPTGSRSAWTARGHGQRLC